MLTALIVVLSTLGYLTIGRIYAKVSRDIWKNHPRTSLRARLCFPSSSREEDVYGKDTSSSWTMPFTMEVFSREEDQRALGMVSSFIWPVFVGWTLAAHLLRLPITIGWRGLKFAFVGLPEFLVGAPARLKGAGKRLLSTESSKPLHRWHQLPPSAPAASEPTLALPEPSDDRGEYIQVIRRRGELMVEMDRLAFKETELAQRLGGPEEARKLLDLPGKKL